ncbi:MAG: hypothetical protein GY754_31825 [bacterium]|nr:hypothetical protein [bacterium]
MRKNEETHGGFIMMLQNYISVGGEAMNLNQFITKVRNYDVELTRLDVLNVIDTAKENCPADVPEILDVIKTTYNISIAC